jgi:hypothetical protein
MNAVLVDKALPANPHALADAADIVHVLFAERL